MNGQYTTQAGSGGRGPVPEPQQGTSIDSATARIEGAWMLVNRLAEKVERLANSVMGTPPTSAEVNTKDHPPNTLQEHITYLESKLTQLDYQVTRFF